MNKCFGESDCQIQLSLDQIDKTAFSILLARAYNTYV